MDRYLEANIILSKFSRDYMDLKKNLPIRPSEMGVLNIIVSRQGKFTPIQLSSMLEVSKPMVTAYISVLEKKGYIRREYLKEDRRSYYIIPTEKGIELVENTAIHVSSQLSTLENSLGKRNFETMLDLMGRSIEILKKK